MAVAGVLEIQMLIEMGRLRSDLDQVKSAVSSTAEHVNGAVETMKHALGALGVGLSIEYFKGLIEGSLEASVQMEHLSKSTDLTVETLAGLGVAAKISGGDIDSIAKSINKMSVEMGKAPEKFKAVGISAKDPLEAFKQLADIYNQIEDPQRRAAFAAGALGKQWAGAAPLLALGGERLQELIDKGTKASGITADMAENAAELHEKWILLFGSGGAVNKVVQEMTPWLVKLVDEFIAAKEASGGFLETIGRFLLLQATGSTNPAAEQLGQVDEKLKALRKTADEFASMGSLQKWFSADDIAIVKSQIALLETQRSSLVKLAEQEAANTKAKEEREKPKQGGGAGLNDKVDTFLDSGASQKKLFEEIAAFNEHVSELELKQIQKTNDASHDRYIQEKKDLTELAKLADDISHAQAEADLKQKAAAAETLQAHFDSGKGLADNVRTQAELEKQSYDERLSALQYYIANSNLSVQDGNALMERFQIDHEAKLGSVMATAAVERRKFQELTTMQQASSIAGILTTLTATTAQKNREMFELNKLASMANAIIYTFEGANKALSMGPWGIPLAAIIIAAGLANVASIASTSFGSGAAPSAGGGGPGVIPTSDVPTVNNQQSAGQTTIVNFHGTNDERALVQRFADMLNENTRDGGKILVPS